MSTRATFYVQECPTCGRRLRVCVEYLGRKIQCRHCGGTFTARDEESSPLSREATFSLMQRVSELLNCEDNSQSHTM
jgi:hypothetical protein